MAIIIVTIIFRAIVSPLMHKQTKSSFQMQKAQPLMQEIRYLDKLIDELAKGKAMGKILRD